MRLWVMEGLADWQRATWTLLHPKSYPSGGSFVREVSAY
jgi:hypothetical protein